MTYDQEQEGEGTFVSINTLIDSGNKPSTEFSYVIREGDGYWTLARYIMEHSGRSYIIRQVTNDRLVGEIAEAIQNDVISKGVTSLNPGDVLLLKDVGYYVPRLGLTGAVEENTEIKAPVEGFNQPESGGMPLSFAYIPKPGTGFMAAARHIMEHSGREWIMQQVEENLELVKEVADAIRMSFESQGMSLQVGQTYTLGAVGAYVPRLAMNIKNSASSNSINTATLSQNFFEIEEELLTNKDVYGTRRDTKDIKAIVLHQTYSSTADSSISWFNKGAASTQYIIDKDGTIIQLLPDSYSGFHIRKGHEKTWVNNMNSIGIEFVGMAYGPKNKEVYEDITPEQQAAGTRLMKELMSKYNISSDNIFRHPEVQAKNRTEAQSVEIPQ